MAAVAGKGRKSSRLHGEVRACRDVFAADVGALSSTSATAADAPWNPYPWKWGKDAIADNPDAALKWWLDQLTNNAVSDSDPSVVLTDEEISQLKAVKPRVGFSWYDLTVYAVEGWKNSGARKPAHGPRLILSTSISKGSRREKKKRPSSLSKSQSSRPDVFRLDAVQLVHEAVLRPRYRDRRHRQPAIGVLSGELRVRRPRELRGARKTDLRVDALKGLHQRRRGLDGRASPSFWIGARHQGFENGIKKYESICKINVVQDNIPVATPPLRKLPPIKPFSGTRTSTSSSCWPISTSAAKRRCELTIDATCGWSRQIWTRARRRRCRAVVGRHTPRLVCRSPSFASANVMGKLLLGKQAPLLVKSSGMVATPDNVAEAYSKMWNGEKLPWH